MAVHSAVPLLPARDVLEAVEWYERELGFRRLFAYPEKDPDYASVARDDAEIHLFRMDVDPKKSDWMIYLRVTGVEELYAEYSARGLIHPNGPLQTKPWGQREFAVIDPNGALLTFGEKAT